MDWEAFRTSGPDSDVKALMRRGASHRPVRTEFHALPATAKVLGAFPVCWRSCPSFSMADFQCAVVQAEILETLANDLLGTQWVRADLDQREADGQLVSGRGGEGGAFAMRPRSAEERQDSGGDGDGNTDICVLCLGGGSLLCCDGCPAAFHMRCIGQAGALPEGEWLCPECALGGRGELDTGQQWVYAGLSGSPQSLMCIVKLQGKALACALPWLAAMPAGSRTTCCSGTCSELHGVGGVGSGTKPWRSCMRPWQSPSARRRCSRRWG